ncbi:MAG: hypothetical protein VKN33_03090 [Candidatus Sericytochromatia bacterium]|nr:hypothetical protein [Candidatus Sericytochromatia bacterium]
MRQITIYLDGVPHTFMQGAEVWMLVARLPESLKRQWKSGGIVFTDNEGNEVGSGGALLDGHSYRTSALRAGSPDVPPR